MSVSTSQPPSREPTPEPLGRSMKEKAVQSMSNVEAEMIYDLCLKLKKSTVATRDYLGLLKGDAEKSTNVAHLHQYHRVWSMPPGDCFNPANQVVMKYPISLCTLFGTDVHSRNISVSIEHRLSLGIKLASSVIQFHKTLWLNGLWCNQDIVFFVNPQTNDPFMETPMVLQKLPLSYSSDSSASRLMCQAVPAVRDINSNILLSLGILLCELWCWKRLKDFDSCRDILKSLQVPDNYNQWTSFALAGAAHEAHKSLGFDAPLPYREAVAACLSKNVPTEDKEFVSTVWEKVVRPLKESLSFFTGEKFVL